MNAGLNDFPSRVFYEGLLAPEARIATARFPHVPGGPYDDLFDPERPAVLALVPHEGFRIRCPAEAEVVAGIVLDRIVRQGGNPATSRWCRPSEPSCASSAPSSGAGSTPRATSGPLPVIDTVERIQGQERELVVVSLVASDPDHLAGDAAGFFYSGNRLNVTMTRARTKLIVVASPLAFTAFPKTLAGLADVERFRRLRRELPSVVVQGPGLG